MISFAFFVPGAATACCALLAVSLSSRTPDAVPTHDDAEASVPTDTRSQKRHGTALVGLTMFTVAYALLILRPVKVTTDHLSAAHAAVNRKSVLSISERPANAYFRRAMEADALDPTPCLEWAKWLLSVSSVPALGNDATNTAIDALALAIQRDPFALRPRRLLMQAYRRRAAVTSTKADYLGAVAASEAALTLYPESPDAMLMLADRQLEAGRAFESNDLLQRAMDTYRRALNLDGARPEWERIRGFHDKKRNATRRQMQRIEDELRSP